MTGRLLKSDPVWRSRRAIVLTGIGLGLFMSMLHALIWDNTGAIYREARFLIRFQAMHSWWVVLAILINFKFWLRSTRLATSLPVTTRQITLLRSGGMVLGLLTMLAITGGVIQALQIWAHLEVPPGYNVWMEMGRAGGFSILFLMLARAPQQDLRRLPINVPYVAYISLLWLSFLFLIMFLPHTVPVLLSLWSFGILLWVADFRRVPDSFNLEPLDGQDRTDASAIRELPPAILATPAEGRLSQALREEVAPAAPAKAASPTEPAPPSVTPTVRASWAEYRATKWSLHVTVWEVLNNHWNLWIQLPIIALYGGICFGAYQTGEDIPLWVIIAMAMWVGSIHSGAEYMHPLDHLPLPRRLLFWHVAGPGLAAAFVGGLIGLQIAGVFGSHKPSDVRFEDREVHVPIEFWEILETGTPPAVEAPWGERYEPEPQRMILSSTVRLYNPYGNIQEHSDRFIAYQMRRGAVKVYGNRVPADWPGSIETVEPSFSEGVERGDFTPDELRGLFSVVRSRVYAVVIAVLFLVATPVILLLLGRLHPAATNRTRTALWLSGLIPAMLVLLLVVFSDPSSKAGARTLYGYPMILLRRWMEGTDIPPGLLWLGTLLVAVGCLLVLQEFFVKAEAVTSKVSKKIEEDL
ncbi:hypothetical protein ACFL4Y_00355 [Gemmatimonadota bacterium]